MSRLALIVTEMLHRHVMNGTAMPPAFLEAGDVYDVVYYSGRFGLLSETYDVEARISDSFLTWNVWLSVSHNKPNKRRTPPYSNRD